RTPSTSSSFMMRYSSPSSFTSLPEYFPKRIRSPCLTARGRFLPSSVTRPVRTRAPLPLRRLLLGAVGNDDAAVLLLVLGEPPDEQAIMQWTPRRRGPPSRCAGGSLSHGAVPLSSSR